MTTEGFTDFQGYKIWYRVAKSATSGSTTPVLLLHGGPGLGSDYLEPLETMAGQGRTIIRFDQLGCGRSDRPRDLELWNIEGVLKQIDSVRKALGLDRIHLLGHSWGGMVALEYFLTRPLFVESLCLCSSVVSVQLWAQEAHRLRLSLPPHLAEALDRCARSFRPPKPPDIEAKPARSLTQDKIDRWARIMKVLSPFIAHPLTSALASLISYLPILCLRSAAYLPLSIQFSLRYDCRLQPMPFAIFRMQAGSNEDIHSTLIGPTEFYPTGILKNWDIRPSLSRIQCPTLILSGLYDEATPLQMEFLREGITGSQQNILDQSSHCGMWEEPEKYRAAILGFINRVEGGGV
jgi:pimeloyl-ACP methyl ester carboxylesterase